MQKSEGAGAVNLDHLKGIRGLGRWLFYRAVFFTGFACSLWVTAVFIFGPDSWNEGKIPHTPLGVLGLLLAIVLPLVVSYACWLLKEHLISRWPYIDM